jgi:hypothetical protein
MLGTIDVSLPGQTPLLPEYQSTQSDIPFIYAGAHILADGGTKAGLCVIALIFPMIPV